ncbi:unnamed protein product [Sphagnum troendelagicum]
MTFFNNSRAYREPGQSLVPGNKTGSYLMIMMRIFFAASSCGPTFVLVAALSLLFVQAPRCSYALTPDGEALLSFKRGIQNAHGALTSWNESDSDPCGWSGIQCNPINRRVYTLNLPYRSLRGFLSPEIGKLDQLRRIGLHRNALFGPIPIELGNCTSLKALYLRGNYFTGNIPDELGHLRHLKTLDVSNNGLTGSIPQSLGFLPNLSFLNVSLNFLSGVIPASGRLSNFTSSSFANNPGLCGPQIHVACHLVPKTTTPENATAPVSVPDLPALAATKYSTGILISTMSTVGGAIFLAVVCFLGWFPYKKAYKDPENIAQVIQTEGCSKLVMFHGDLPYASSEILKRIEDLTDEDIIGSGGYGTVYRLVMDDGCMFAVKKIDKQGASSECLFERELEILGSFKHRNLVNLRGYCCAPAANLLLYDYLPGGSLDHNLHERESHEELLSWADRMKIATGAARGLAYLHHDCCPRIIHRDIKSSNILLDARLEPYVSDFGLAKLLDDDDSHVTTIVAGTFGYLAPEYMQSGRATEKGDVYSYGVMLLELISGKRPTDPSLMNQGMNLVGWATSCIRQNRHLELVDRRCSEGIPHEHLEAVLHIAARCIAPMPDERPTMDQVVQMLQLDTLSPCLSELSIFHGSPLSDPDCCGR